MPEAPRRGVLAWSITFVAYVALGYATKGLVLNWIVGPLFPLLALVILPRILRRQPDGEHTP